MATNPQLRGIRLGNFPNTIPPNMPKLKAFHLVYNNYIPPNMPKLKAFRLAGTTAAIQTRLFGASLSGMTIAS